MPSFQPYWGKPAVRNDRGDRGDVGTVLESPIRASVLPDWQWLDRLRDGPSTRSGLFPVRAELVAGVRYFGRYRAGGWIRDGVLLSGG
jgi:hypothetical protein